MAVTSASPAAPIRSARQFWSHISPGSVAKAVLVIITLAIAAYLWAVSLPRFDMRQMNDLGLVSIAPPQFLAAIVLIAAAFVLSVRLDNTRVSATLACVAVLLLVAVIHGLPSFVEDTPRQSVAYLHAGFTDEIERTGQLLTRFDARFSWPVFFSLGALVTSVAGIQSAIELQAWAAPVLEVAYLVPLYAIYGGLTTDKRLIWTGLLFFAATNWVGQDYYSPQGFNFLIYLTVLAILLRWFRQRGVVAPIRHTIDFLDRHWPNLRHAESGATEPTADLVAAPAQRVVLGGIVVLLVAVSVASHQLTPFAILAAVTTLTVLRRTTMRGLPVLTAVLIGMWISYMTVAFLQGHLADLVADVGAVGGTTTVNVTRRLVGSPAHTFVVQARLVATAVLWLLGAAGAIRRFRHRHLDIEAIALAAVPFGLIAFQAYGGEMFLRVYLFSLPFIAFLAAGLLFPVAERRLSPSTTRTLLVVAAVFALTLMVTKHGNERADWMSADELSAADYLYATAPPGSLLATVNGASPIRYRQLEMHAYLGLTYVYLFDEAKVAEQFMAGYHSCAYIFASRAQHANAEMYGGLPPGYWEAAREKLVKSGRFSIVYENRDATIFLMNSTRSLCLASTR